MIQPLDGLTLACLVREYQDTLVGARIQKVQQLSATDWLLSVFGPGGQGKFFFSVKPQMPCCFTFWGNREASGLPDWLKPSNAQPSGFCMLLRKHLVGAQIRQVETLPGERVLNLHVENATELGFQSRVMLSLELMGKHSNALLVDRSQGPDVQPRILGAAHTVGEAQSREREVAAGLPYLPPPLPRQKQPWETLSFETFQQGMAAAVDAGQRADWISQRVAGMGKQMTRSLLESLPVYSDEAAFQMFQALNRHQQPLSPALVDGGEGYTLLSPGKPQVSLNGLLQSYYLRRLETLQMVQRTRELSQVLEKQIRQVQNRLDSLVISEEERPEQWQAKADRLLLAINMGELPVHPQHLMPTVGEDGPKPEVGANPSLLLKSLEDGTTCEVTLNPRISWMDNVQMLYKRVKKLKSKQALFEKESQQFQDRLAYFENLSCWLAQAETMAELAMMREEFVAAGWIPRQGKPATQGKASLTDKMTGVLALTSSEGVPLWVGRTGQGNAQLLSRWAKPHDIWVHVHQMPGSHVLVRPVEGRSISDQTLLEALQLAVYYSAGRSGSQVPVVYTEYRHVRKIPGSYPGHVTYSKEQQAYINPDSAMVEGLLRRRPDAVD